MPNISPILPVITSAWADALYSSHLIPAAFFRLLPALFVSELIDCPPKNGTTGSDIAKFFHRFIAHVVRFAVILLDANHALIIPRIKNIVKNHKIASPKNHKVLYLASLKIDQVICVLARPV